MLSLQEGISTFRYFQVLSGTFRRFQVLSGTFRRFQVLSGAFRRFQVLSGAFRYFQALSGAFKYFQALSGEIKQKSANTLGRYYLTSKGQQPMEFPYDEQKVNKIMERLSKERLSRYLNHYKCSEKEGLEYYMKNAVLSSSIYIPVQGLEVCLRNSLNNVLCETYGEKWYTNSKELQRQELESIQKAKQSIENDKYTVTLGRIVAALHLGFWTALIEKKQYDTTIWRFSLRKGFPNGVKLSRSDVTKEIAPIRRLRNRIAHHEPIIFGDLLDDYERIMKVLNWICPTTASWIKHYSTFEAVYHANIEIFKP